MLVILPPSETKSDGGSGAPLDLDRLWLPELNPVRRRIADALVELAADLDASQRALGLGKAQLAEVDRNADLFESPTRPAIERYTGVAYDALDYRGLTRASKAKAADRLAIGSALFGVVRASDPIPAYRLSGGSKLPGFGTLASVWKPALSPALDAIDDFVLDLRSGAYLSLGPVRGAVTATVVTERPDGSRTVVSHFNKHYKGLIARDLVRTRARVGDIDKLAAVLSDAGHHVEITSPTEITVVTE
ncbi:MULTISPECIES: peroxide stress protein YaaA [unclassified Gordonia (in: high G+C Gram-positive bacteria)]|uniref:peroxide stress protein YaaA n=1 Tax=unclassified Gordonia (in: high G+C Gram-positive bacteria) TaxID=2657482 RepID=UPI00200001A2|nr:MULTISPECIES: peroxide stress protein YaaA [unclassified Gordonia (in: high G+C Gram-positive bacteria)]UQE73400.1 peroxide stress protein YaaA [Gordonia sp. PP30]